MNKTTEKNRTIKSLLASFLKIGTIGFGGGTALIPVVGNEVVTKKHYITDERFTEHTILSNITPGALPVKLTMLTGFDVSGLSGLSAGAYGVALPGTFLTILVLSLISIIGEKAISFVEYASVGISVFIIYLLFSYIKKVFSDAAKNGSFLTAFIVAAISAVLTFGGELRSASTYFFGESDFSNSSPVFDIPTLDLLILAFFAVLFTSGRFKSIRGAIAFIIGICYSLSVGKSGIIPHSAVLYLRIIMLVSALVFTVYDVKRGGSKITSKPDFRLFFKKLSIFIIPLIISGAAAFIVAGNITDYTVNGIVSAVTSFGGGAAYISVADGMFVSPGIVSSQAFYGTVIPISNAMPGLLVVKLLAAVGYEVGLSDGSVFSGIVVSVFGFFIGVSLTAAVCIIVEMLFKAFSSLPVFDALKKIILPVICGLLISTTLTMIITMLEVSSNSGHTALPMIVAALLFIMTVIVKLKTKAPDILLILINGIVTLSLFIII